MLAVVTGGLSYIGKYITGRLLASGQQVTVLTGHPRRENPLGDRVTVAPFCFDDEPRLVSVLSGAATLFNTYWVRFDRGTVSFEKAIEHTRRLIRAAETAGVHRIVHLSVATPSKDSPFPYFRGKAVLENMIAESKLSYAIIRPTLVFGGPEEILVNNLAWLLRRFPVFAIPDPGSYRLQPIHVDEVADLAIKVALEGPNTILDAAGPDILTFEERDGRADQAQDQESRPPIQGESGCRTLVAAGRRPICPGRGADTRRAWRVDSRTVGVQGAAGRQGSIR